MGELPISSFSVIYLAQPFILSGCVLESNQDL